MPDIERYSDFVEHPRYGRQPRFTGLDPESNFAGSTFFHWNSPESCRIPNTAIAADLDRQVPATVPVTHYFDVERKCRDCGRMFIFFAVEQQFWYEKLGFPLESDCVRCVQCRKRQRGVAEIRERYEDLFNRPDRTAEQDLTMAECSLELMEHGLFPPRQTQRVREQLNRVGDDARFVDRVALIRERLLSIEAGVRIHLLPRWPAR
jgi:hypothetical protein